MQKVSYDEFVKEAQEGRELCEYKYNVIWLCDEMFADVVYKKTYYDKKIFDKNGSYLKPTEMCMFEKESRMEFEGIKHEDESWICSPEDSLVLLAGIESFLSNQLNPNKTYKEKTHSLRVIKRGDEHLLCIEYGYNRRESHLDKYRAKIVVTLLRNIINKSSNRY